MIKLKKLINESAPGFTKRKFGDPLPTLEDVMKQHQESKLQEDWWDDMDASAQAQYIKAHPGSKQAQQADDEPEGGEEPSGEPEGDDDTTVGDVDKVFKQVKHGISDDEWNKVPPKVKKAFRSKVTKIYSTMKKLDDNNEYEKLDKMQEKFGLQLWQAEGLYDDFVKGDAGSEFDDEEGGEPEGGEEPSGDEPSSVEVPDDESEWAIEMKDGGPMGNEYEELKRDLKWADNDEEKAELETRLEDFQNKYNAYVKKGVEKGWIDKDGYRRGVRVAFAGIPDEGGEQGRTGNELNQETLTIDGKQYRRISEGVEKQPKPKDSRNRSKKMKKHILQENYERMFGSIKEDWWDDMDATAQAAYIKKHPGSQQSQDADKDEKDYGDTRNAQHFSDEPEDGGEPEGEPSGEPKGEPSAWSQKAQKAKDEFEDLSDPDEIGDWIEDNKWKLSGGKLGRAADLEFAPVQKAYAELEDAYTAAEEEDDWDAYDKAKEDLTKLANQKLDSQMVSRRTGKELDQETLTIDGKQFRRMNEGVEKQPKPKYEFSEFYKRFKR